MNNIIDINKKRSTWYVERFRLLFNDSTSAAEYC